VQVLDEGSGVNYVQGYFVSPMGTSILPLFFQGGAEQDSTMPLSLSATLTILPGVEAGEYKLSLEGAYQLTAVDRVGNRGLYTNVTLPNSPSLSIISNTDTTPPTISTISCSPNPIGIPQGSATTATDLTCSIFANDDSTGIESLVMTLVSSTASQRLVVEFTNADKVLGVGTSSGYQTTVSLPSTTELGPWALQRWDAVVARDDTGNSRSIPSSDLQDTGLEAVAAGEEGPGGHSGSPATTTSGAVRSNHGIHTRQASVVTAVCLIVLSSLWRSMRTACISL